MNTWDLEFDRDKFHRIYGRHSNIPECCIDFWLTDFKRILRDNQSLARHDALQRHYERVIRKRFHYRPCLNCLRSGQWHPIHICNGQPCEDFADKLRIYLAAEAAKKAA